MKVQAVNEGSVCCVRLRVLAWCVAIVWVEQVGCWSLQP